MDSFIHLSIRVSRPLRVAYAFMMRPAGLRNDLEQDRRQVSSRGLVVKAEAHQRHRLQAARAAGEAPAEQLGVARGHQKSGAQEFSGGGDHGLKIVKSFGDRMSEDAERGGVP